LLVRLISQDALILFKGVDQVKKWLGWQLMRLDGSRQGDENGSGSAAGEAIEGLPAKVGQEEEGFVAVAGFITQIIGDAAKGIDVAEVLPEMPGKQQGNNREVFVMIGDQLPGLKLRRLGIGSGGAGHLDR
jgi:hypothetical protein